jgi:hypothetical protein
MAKRKQFSAAESVYRPADTHIQTAGGTVPLEVESLSSANALIVFPENNATGGKAFDFSPFYGFGYDDITKACQRTIQELLAEAIKSLGNTLSVTTIVNYCRNGLNHFLPFCKLMVSALGHELNLININRGLVDQYIAHLASDGNKLTTQRLNYTNTKSILTAMSKRGLIPGDIFPKNPYPNNNRQTKGQRPLSNAERKQVIRSLKTELLRVEKKTGALSSYDLVVCMLGIATRTGLNPTPISELPVNCLRPHPLKENRQLLVSYKRRGNTTQIQSLRKIDDIELLRTVMMDVSQIINIVAIANAKIREKSHYPDRLFVFQLTQGPDYGNASRISAHILRKSINTFVKRFNLRNDDGHPLVLNVMRLRKTFENRIWELSGQDPFITAALGGHSVKVSNDHYLEAPAESEENWRMMGEIRVAELLEQNNSTVQPKSNTPVAGCKDSRFGHRAPKNGQHCSEFLNCFRCRSFVVTGEDLYRLFSLYWLLVSERKLMGPRRWSQYYAHIIRIIDNQIAPQFDTIKVQVARDKAQAEPHPFWRSREQLGWDT